MRNRTGLTLLGFLVAVAAVFGGGYLIGNRSPAIAAAPDPVESGDGHAAGSDDGPMSEMSTGAAHSADEPPPGLAVAEAGYSLRLESPTVLPAGRADLRFAIVGPDGDPVTKYQRSHEKDLHLIVVSRDLGAFRHVHPTLGSDGTWSVPVGLDRPGGWHLYADFTPQGTDHPLVLATDVTVTGQLAPQPLPAPATVAESDGYRVELAGRPRAGESAELTFTVTRDGAPVTDLTPYLGADGHLVALRVGDLAYLHTHPQDHEPTGGPQIRFAATFPTAGSYRVFLDFEHAGQVHTAPFTVTVG